MLPPDPPTKARSMSPLLPPPDRLTVLFAHNAFDFLPRFQALETGIRALQVTTREALRAALPQADVLVVSHLWEGDMLPLAERLVYLQSVSSGTERFDPAALRGRGVLLASGQGVNADAVSDHAMGLLLSLTRQLAQARDDQTAGRWRRMQPDPAKRLDELPGKTLLLVGLGAIGDRIAMLARAFGMTVVGVRRDPARGPGHAHEVHGFRDLPALIPRADVVALACPLTEDTRNLLDAAAIAALRPGALVINVGRGACIDEPALIAALQEGRLAGAGLDVTATEPLPAASPLWSLPNVVLTAHCAGESRGYEGKVLDLLRRNLERLWSGDTALENRIV